VAFDGPKDAGGINLVNLIRFERSSVSFQRFISGPFFSQWAPLHDNKNTSSGLKCGHSGKDDGPKSSFHSNGLLQPDLLTKNGVEHAAAQFNAVRRP
jgi:hypothetical protein